MISHSLRALSWPLARSLQLNFVLCDGTLFRLGFVHPASQQLPPNRVPGGLYASVLASAPNVYNYIAGGRIPISVSGAGDTLVYGNFDNFVTIYHEVLSRIPPHTCGVAYSA